MVEISASVWIAIGAAVGLCCLLLLCCGGGGKGDYSPIDTADGAPVPSSQQIVKSSKSKKSSSKDKKSKKSSSKDKKKSSSR
jgi:hypothetical protein